MAAEFTILFVEDDKGVLGVMAQALSAKGFRIRAAESGDEALRILAQERVDLLFTDIVMPDRNGIELVREAKRLRPDLPVLMATAYYSRAEEAASLGRLLFKPLRADEIEAEINAALGVA